MADATQKTAQRTPPDKRRLSRQTVDTGLGLLLEQRWRELGKASRRFALHADSDPEALHDLRVALRRLRSLYRAFATALHDTSDIQAELRQCFKETGAGRDREVSLYWIQQLELPLPWLETRWQHALAQDRQALAHLPERLSPLVQQPAQACHSDIAATLGELAAGELEKKLSRFARTLKRLCKQWDDSRAHRLRIRGKRLRYLIEPFARQHRPCTRAVETLKQLQDLLGDHHDMTILRARLKTLRRGEHDATRRQQLKAARRLLKGQQQRLQERIVLEYCQQGRKTMLKSLQATRLSLLPAPPPPAARTPP